METLSKTDVSLIYQTYKLESQVKIKIILLPFKNNLKV